MLDSTERRQRLSQISRDLKELSRDMQPGDAQTITELRAEVLRLVAISRRDRMVRSAERRAQFAERRAMKAK